MLPRSPASLSPQYDPGTFSPAASWRNAAPYRCERSETDACATAPTRTTSAGLERAFTEKSESSEAAHHQRHEVARERGAQDFLFAFLGEQLGFIEADVARGGDLFLVDERLAFGGDRELHLVGEF